MTFRANGPWYASLIGLGLPLVACSSSERPSGDDGSGTGASPSAGSAGAGVTAFLNENEFLSSDPGAGSGGVSITFYERQ